jgi:glycerol-3-phosphate O-acyltransferase
MYPDNMIKLLLKSYIGLKQYKYDFKIVPVSIEYDRIFDSNYLSTEIKRGIFAPGNTLFNVMRKIFSNRKHRLGKCVVTHEEPIDLDSYVNDYFNSRGKTLAVNLYSKEQGKNHAGNQLQYNN